MDWRYKTGLFLSSLLLKKQSFRVNYFRSLNDDLNQLIVTYSKIEREFDEDITKTIQYVSDMKVNIEKQAAFVDDEYKKDYIHNVNNLAEYRRVVLTEKEKVLAQLDEKIKKTKKEIEYLKNVIGFVEEFREHKVTKDSWL